MRRSRVYYAKLAGGRSMFVAPRLISHFAAVWMPRRKDEPLVLSDAAQPVGPRLIPTSSSRAVSLRRGICGVLLIDNAFNIYTDGSSYSHPRVGGIGIRFVTIDTEGAEVVEDVPLPGFKAATNNQMELYACVVALKEALKYQDLTPYQKIAIHTDSRYIVDNHKRALFEWSANRWRNRDGRPVLNADLWKQLIKLVWKCQPRRVEFHWVKGHSRDLHNRAADKLAKKSAKNPLNRPLSIVNVRRNTAGMSEERGSVEMHGQRLRIRVITDEFLTTQRIYKYKYEVISKGSRYFGRVDVIFSSELLKAGHHYEVRVNKQTGNPNIVTIIRELER